MKLGELKFKPADFLGACWDTESGFLMDVDRAAEEANKILAEKLPRFLESDLRVLGWNLHQLHEAQLFWRKNNVGEPKKERS